MLITCKYQTNHFKLNFVQPCVYVEQGCSSSRQCPLQAHHSQQGNGRSERTLFHYTNMFEAMVDAMMGDIVGIKIQKQKIIGMKNKI